MKSNNKENIIEVKHNYSINGVLEYTEYIVNGELVEGHIVNGELVEGYYTLDSLKSTLENVFNFKNIVVKKYGKLCI
jgi:hypothetical protein